MATRSGRAAAPLAAFVLHHWDWSESSLILDLFTREQGRLAVAAKGAKRPYSQLRSVLLPFQRVHVQLGRVPVDDAGEVQTLRSAEFAGGVPVRCGDALFSGFYLNELLIKLVARHDAHPVLFDAYADTLPRLADEAAAQPALRAFELVLLREVGLLPDLRVLTATLAPVRAGEGHALLAEAGVVPSRDEPSIDGRTLLAAQSALDAHDLDRLRAACATALPALRAQLRTLLHYHLGSTLRTRQLMVDVQKLIDTATPR